MSIWSKEMTNRAVELWRMGRSAGVIARELNTTRNMVAGKIYRLDITRKPAGPRFVLGPKAKHPHAKHPNPSKRVWTREPEPLWVTILHLGRRQCCFPRHGESDQVFYCGLPTKGGSWCSRHDKIVHVRRTREAR